MSESDLLDFDGLLAPISDENPCGSNFDLGENTELSHLFSELRALTPIARKIEAKRFEIAGMGPADRQESLSHSDGKSDGPQADPKWGRIRDLAIEILTAHSKDTRVMVSLIESMTRLDGLPGMRDAFKACSQILDKYKLAIFPAPDPGTGNYYCLEFFGKICESEMNNMKAAIYQAEIFEDHDGFSWFSHISASNLENRSASEKEECIQAGDVSLDNFNSVLNNISEIGKLNSFDTKITQALTEAKNFDAMLTTYSGSRIGIGRILDDLAKLQRWYRGLIEDRKKIVEAMAPIESTEGDSDAPDNEADGIGTNGPGTNGPGTNGGSRLGAQGAIANREQALNNLLQVAAYFRKAEPHSPVSYALEQAVRWGKLSLPNLLRDLVADTSVLAEMYRRMGIQDSPDNSDG